MFSGGFYTCIISVQHQINIISHLAYIAGICIKIWGRDVTRTLIGGGGERLFIYSCSARRNSFEFELISKEIRRA